MYYRKYIKYKHKYLGGSAISEGANNCMICLGEYNNINKKPVSIHSGLTKPLNKDTLINNNNHF